MLAPRWVKKGGKIPLFKKIAYLQRIQDLGNPMLGAICHPAGTLPPSFEPFVSVYSICISAPNAVFIPRGLSSLNDLSDFSLDAPLCEISPELAAIKQPIAIALVNIQTADIPTEVLNNENIHSLSLSSSLNYLPNNLHMLKAAALTLRFPNAKAENSIFSIESLAYLAISCADMDNINSIHSHSKLETLELNCPTLASIPAYLANLSHLNELIVISLLIANIPDWVFTVTRLQCLYVHTNAINDAQVADYKQRVKNKSQGLKYLHITEYLES